MAISEKQARQIAEKMIHESGENVAIAGFHSIAYTDDEVLYCFGVEDLDTGEYHYPGEMFKSILGDGTLVDYAIQPPTF